MEQKKRRRTIGLMQDISNETPEERRRYRRKTVEAVAGPLATKGAKAVGKAIGHATAGVTGRLVKKAMVDSNRRMIGPPDLPKQAKQLTAEELRQARRRNEQNKRRPRPKPLRD